MQVKDGFTLLRLDEFSEWLSKKVITRTVNKIQLHHTYIPNYGHFKGNNHFELQKSMKTSHVNGRGFSDIAQHFTIFPDGRIMTGRSLNMNPAGITGNNSKAICIENLGNFDIGGDVMTEIQQEAIVEVVISLCNRFKLKPEISVVYHSWYTTQGNYLNNYIPGRSAKTCPGTNFFGGNKRIDFETELLPYLKGEKDFMTEERVKEIVKEILSGENTKPSEWAKKTEEWDEATEKKITDGTRPQGYAKREEVAAMILRTLKNE